jgi:hypothetical protein
MIGVLKSRELLRRASLQTMGDAELDVDAIPAGIAVSLRGLNDEVTIATTNVRHFGRFPEVDVREWFSIMCTGGSGIDSGAESKGSGAATDKTGRAGSDGFRPFSTKILWHNRLCLKTR